MILYHCRISQNIFKYKLKCTKIHIIVHFFTQLLFELYTIMAKKRNHRGEILKNVVKNLGVATKVAAKKAGYSRSAYYKHIEDEDLSLHILLKYGKGLEYDFSKFIPEINSIDYKQIGTPATLKEALKQIDMLKEKYYSLLEKYNKLLEEKK